MNTSSMLCEELSDLLDIHLDGELPTELSDRLERHLLHCPQCALQARSLEQTRARLRAAYGEAEPSPAFQERMSARLESAFSDVIRPVTVVNTSQRLLPLTLD